MNTAWKSGRGTLGALQPLLGSWLARAESPMGPVECTRTFTRFGSKYIRLSATWKFGETVYEELALFGAADDGGTAFWSFTNDGKRSEGRLADASDLDARAVGFEAQMPAGLARFAYWPDEGDGFYWAAEAKTKKGWRRMSYHHYRPRGPESAA